MQRKMVMPEYMLYRRGKMTRLTNMMDMRLEFVDELHGLSQELTTREVDLFERALKRDNIVTAVRAVDSEYDEMPVATTGWWESFLDIQEWNPDETEDLDWSGLKL